MNRMSSKKSLQVSGEQITFDWEFIDDTYVPVIFRDDIKFVSVRIVELKLLTRFPKVLPEDLRAIRRCVSVFMTDKEAMVLDEINLGLCKGEYGKERFTANDVLVELDEFRDFFELVSDTVICKVAISMGLTEGGWLQINNTVCPYVWMNNVRHLPHEVVCLAAELLPEDDPILKTKVTADQLAVLNRLCNSVSRDFAFDDNTKLVSLLTLKLEANPVVLELPTDQPFEHATYVDIMLEKQSVHQLKARTKELMNAYYNTAIVRKFNEDNEAKRKISTSTQSEVQKEYSSHSKTKPSASSALGASAEAHKKTCAGRVRSKPATASTAASTTKSTSSTSRSKQYPGTKSNSSPAEAKKAVSSASACPASRPMSAASIPDLDSSPSSLSLADAESRPSSTMSAQSADSVKLTDSTQRNKVVEKSRKRPSSELSSLYAAHKRRTSGSSPTCQSPQSTWSNHGRNMLDIYKLPPKQDFTVDSSLVKFVASWGKHMESFSKCLTMGEQVNMAVLGLVDKSVRVSYIVKYLLRRSLEILREENVQMDVPSKEAAIVVDDAISNIKFWTASGHQVTVAGADKINTTLVKAALTEHSYSFQRCPDIVHYMVAGVFGARTRSAAANFRFLQEMMTIGCVASGKGDYSSFSAYKFAQRRFIELSRILSCWCSFVSVQAPPTSDADFVRTVYQLYDKVYNSTSKTLPSTLSQNAACSLYAPSTTSSDDQPLHKLIPLETISSLLQQTTFSSPVQPLPPPYTSAPPALAGVCAPAFAQLMQPAIPITQSMVTQQQPITQSMVTQQQPITQPMVTQQQPITQPMVTQQQPITQPMLTQQQPITQSMVTQQQPITQSMLTQQQPITQPMLTQQQPITQSMVTQQQPITQSMLTQQQPITQSMLTQQQPITQPMLTQQQPITQPMMTHQAPSQQFYPQQAYPSQLSGAANQISPANQQFPQPLKASPCTTALLPDVAVMPKVAETSQSIIGLPVANPVHASNSALAQNAPSQATSTDLSDCISLCRAHGKKITSYKNDQSHWLLLEDVQKIYYPRMDLNVFVDKINELGIISFEIVRDVARAFRHHYGMTDDEEFEVNKMMTFFSLSDVIAKLKV